MGRWSVRRGAREGHGTRLEVRAFWGRLCCAESDTLAAPGGDQESISAKDSIFFSYFFVFRLRFNFVKLGWEKKLMHRIMITVEPDWHCCPRLS